MTKATRQHSQWTAVWTLREKKLRVYSLSQLHADDNKKQCPRESRLILLKKYNKEYIGNKKNISQATQRKLSDIY